MKSTTPRESGGKRKAHSHVEVEQFIDILNNKVQQNIPQITNIYLNLWQKKKGRRGDKTVKIHNMHDIYEKSKALRWTFMVTLYLLSMRFRLLHNSEFATSSTPSRNQYTFVLLHYLNTHIILFLNTI
jgi:hypothetical protein